MSYNLSGQKSGIKLDGATVANIFLGKIKTWNDPAIKSLNPGLSLPSTAITVVHRSDSSGTTKGFTTFLSDYSSTWKSQVGADKDVKWPTGTGAKGNSGVAAAVKQTDGAIGYVEQAYALQNGFTYAAVKNSSGSYVLPTLAEHLGGGGRDQDPGRPGDLDDQLAEPDRVPDRVADIPRHVHGHVQGRHPSGSGEGDEAVPDLRAR